MLIPVDRVIDTVLSWFELERNVYDTLIDQHFQGRRITFFKGLRKVIPESDYPSIEVGPTSDQWSWEFVRVQGDTMALEIHITTSNKNPADALVLSSRLASLTGRILTRPQHLRGRIEGTSHWFQDCNVGPVTYNAGGYNFNIRVDQIAWSGKILEYLDDSDFDPSMQAGTGKWA